MANSKVVEIGADQQLQGKSNFISWLRTFERAAKAKDIWKLLIGEEEIIETQPQEEDYIVYLGGDTVTQGRTLRSALTPPNTGDAPQQQRPTTDPTHSVLKWQAAYKKWERSQGKARGRKREEATAHPHLTALTLFRAIAPSVQGFEPPPQT